MSNLSIIQSSERRSLPNVIAQSAQRTGVDFKYLMAQAQLESGMRPDAKASTSSATGLYQFVEQTWLGLVKKKGGEYGLGWAQNAISQNRNGKFTIADNSQKSAILALRNNPELSANLAGEFARDNSDYLENRIGREPESVDLYLAHFLGPAGAGKFLSALDANPHAPAAPSFANAAQSNRSIFYTKAGAARSFQDIRNLFANKLENASMFAGGGNSFPTAGNNLPQSQRPMPMVQPADYLRIAKNHINDQGNPDKSRPFDESAKVAYLMLASLGL
ncbi:transglycosylase SLT domain-containing protein [Parasphingorhabdus halotolerans]|uniref:Lytic transglycosylase domain-containing protein n=1 Tax=Parasphingorhabdus halotolerans TaxID=2725558 RepID=A0A6H2DH65_9SPHN|nr:transglycosylase SLT domain-containing protein [Parasphingorhabdus halotolerans]QJB68012.1 lytic transglycosylase domain-containing protein [Parasphingorhabdus halotolerans]